MNDNTEQSGPQIRKECLICGRDYVEKYLDSSTIKFVLSLLQFINNVKHLIVQLMHTNCEILRLLK
jgi:hypothetical protein